MSFQHVAWALRDAPCKSATERLVLMCLGEHANHSTGICWPGQKAIAEFCFLTRQTVCETLNELARRGLIQIEHRTNGKGGKATSIYRFPIIRVKADGFSQAGVERDDDELGYEPPPMSATPTTHVGHADNPCRPRRHTHVGHADINRKSLTEKENREENREEAASSGKPSDDGPPGGRKKSKATTLKTYIQACIDADAPAIPGIDPVFDYVVKIQLPDAMLDLAWKVFQGKYLDTAKKQASWPQTFRNAVKDNWYKLWWKDANGWALTTAGKQAALEHGMDFSHG